MVGFALRHNAFKIVLASKSDQRLAKAVYMVAVKKTFAAFGTIA